MDRLHAMEVFVAVAELHGFAPAARKLGLSPPAVTRLVAGLEEHLGARLLHRTTRVVNPTEAGKRYLIHAQAILAAIQQAESAAAGDHAQPSGRLVVAAPNLFGRMHVAPALSRYLARHPGVAGELSLSDRMVNLVEDGVDAAVRIGVLEDTSLVARRVGATRRVVVASPAYLKDHGMPRRPKDLRNHRLIQFTALQPSPEWRFAGTRGERIPFVPAFATNSADAAIGHAQLGGGLAMVLGYQVRDAVVAGRLRVVLKSQEPPPLPIQVVYPSTRLLPARVRTFVDHILATCDWRFVDF